MVKTKTRRGKSSKTRSSETELRLDYSRFSSTHKKIVLHGRELGTSKCPKEWAAKYYFDNKAAKAACDFVENFIRHVEGPIAGQLFILEPWERAALREIFGWKRRSDKTRKYRRVYFFLPRKNGKSILASAIALYLLFCDGEQGAQIYSAASDREQAGIVFEVAKKMIEASEDLLEMCEVFKRSIVDYSSGGSYKVLSSDAPNKHGKNSHGILFDELHTQKTRELWDTLTTSTSARAQPLVVAMTTAGYDKSTICWEVHDYALGVRDGIILDDEFLPILYGADEDDDWTKEETWFKANPNLGISKSLEYMRTECERAKNSPSYENTFKRLELNMWTEQESRWIQMDKWDLCSEPVDEKSLVGEPCYLGLDLSSNRDITAAMGLFPRELVKEEVAPDLIKDLSQEQIDRFLESMGYDQNGIRFVRRYDTLGWFWCPEETVKLRSGKLIGGEKETSRAARAKYNDWVQSGHLMTTPGNVIDYDRIRIKLNEIGDLYQIMELGYDPWNAMQLVLQLMGDGFKCVPVRQGFPSLSGPTKELETLVLSKRISHGGNPVLRWMARNVSAVQDSAGNIKPDKEKSADKIDGIVGLVVAIARAIQNDGGSVYDSRGLLVAG